MSVLPPYSGPVSKCAKCAHGTADTEWMPSHVTINRWGQVHDTGHQGIGEAEPGWLLRRCGRCRYGWAEATEDARVGG